MNNFGVGVMFIYRKYDNSAAAHSRDRRQRVRLSRLDVLTGPVAFTAACGNATCGADELYRLLLQARHDSHGDTIRRTTSSSTTPTQGLELTARKRLSNHWMMSGSYVYNKQLSFNTLVPSLDYLDPTNRFPTETSAATRTAAATARTFQAVGDVPVPVRHHGVGVLQRAFELPVQHLHRHGAGANRHADNVNILLRPINTERSAGGEDARPELRQVDPAGRRAPHHPERGDLQHREHQHDARH